MNVIRINGKSEPFTTPCSLEAVLLRRGISKEKKGVAVAYNGSVAQKSEWTKIEVKPGDQIEIIHAVQGG